MAVRNNLKNFPRGNSPQYFFQIGRKRHVLEIPVGEVNFYIPIGQGERANVIRIDTAVQRLNRWRWPAKKPVSFESVQV